MPIYYKYYNKNKGAQVILETGKCINKLQIPSIELFDVIKRDVEKESMKLVTLAKIAVVGPCIVCHFCAMWDVIVLLLFPN